IVSYAAAHVAAQRAVGDSQRRVAAGVTVVVDAARVGAGRVTANSAIVDGNRCAALVTKVVDAASHGEARVAAEGAVGDCQGRAAAGATVVVDAAAVVGTVAAQGAVDDCQSSVAVGSTVVIDGTAPKAALVADQGATVNGQCRVIIINSGAVGDSPVFDSDSKNGNGFTG